MLLTSGVYALNIDVVFFFNGIKMQVGQKVKQKIQAREWLMGEAMDFTFTSYTFF